MVGLIGFGAMLVARPFVHFGQAPEVLDSLPPAFVEIESDRATMARQSASDSELEDRMSRPVERVVAVGSGDTLMDVMLRAGVESGEANLALDALLGIYNPRSLKAGQKVTVTFDRPPHGFGQGDFSQVSLLADPIRRVSAKRANKGFAAEETQRQVVRHLAHYNGTIKSSLYESAANAGIPAPIILAMIRTLSYDVDFQRDIHQGDGFEVLFEGWYDTKGKLVRHGDMQYASVTLSGEQIRIYRHEDASGTAEYYNAKGESIKKALLKTPVDGAKITSGFGMRNHPILGFSKMHKGVDFGVPTGTPIMAAGDGVVEMAGFNGAYGNYVRIRHGSGYGTAYAHMSRIAQGLTVGRRVGQGQIVGYVGSTGRSTGPHLHYEVLVGNAQINPLSIKVPTGIKLAGKDLERFAAAKRQTETLLAKIPPSTKVALNSQGKPGALTN